MKKEFELLAPGGDIEAIKAAIVAGADAIYCGLDEFNARQRAENIVFDDLVRLLNCAHQYDCKIFLTLNIMLLEREIPAMIRLLNRLANSKIDGVIVQDIGLFHILSQHFKTLDVHASTQVTTHNAGQLAFLHRLGASRANLCRELNIDEIAELTQAAHQQQMQTEVFVHGSNCIGFSGLCYFSSVQNGNSGNRGRCSQPCRDGYQTTNAGFDYPLNLKDNSAFFDLQALSDAGVDSLKIEGRIKKSHYVHTIVKSWRRQLERFYRGESTQKEDLDRFRVFNRDLSDGYLKGTLGSAMFIDNPRDNAVNHFVRKYGFSTPEQIQQVKRELYDAKTAFIAEVTENTQALTLAKMPVTISVSGEAGQPLRVLVQRNEQHHALESVSLLAYSEQYAIDHSGIEKRFKSLNSADVDIAMIETTALGANLFVPFKELTQLKQQIALWLNDGRAVLSPVTLSKLEDPEPVTSPARLAVLINYGQDPKPYRQQNVDIYYQLPEDIHGHYAKVAAQLVDHPWLIPWFPSILIGTSYEAATTLLEQLKPQRIVTNNSGIGYQAFRLGIKWIAGPQLNIANSYSLLSLQQDFNASGAFISNELNRDQIARIKRPEHFELHYSIFHPNLLFSSRQCLFQRTIGCKKAQMDDGCLQRCQKSTSIINLNGTSLVIDKLRGSYNGLYASEHFLNTSIPQALGSMFAGFLIDLREIQTQTRWDRDPAVVIDLFQRCIAGDDSVIQVINRSFQPSNCSQYERGLL